MAHRVIAALALCIACAWLGLASPPAQAQSIGLSKLRCPDAKIIGAGLISKICWGAMFPLKIGGVSVFSAKDNIKLPDGVNTQPVCACGGDLKRGVLPTAGISLGLWQPARVVEIVRKPYCMPLFGGLQLPIDQTAGGERQQGFTYTVPDHHPAPFMGNFVFMNWNFYVFPVLQALKLFDAPGCNPGGYVDFDMPALMSGFFPNWYDPELAYFLNPDVSLLTIPAMMAAQPVECGYAAFNRAPIDKFWMTAGCWGNIPPYTGSVTPASSVRASSLLSTRVISLLSRMPTTLVQRTVGPDAVCQPQDMPIMKKSQYKMSMLFPVPESKSYTNTVPETGGFGGQADEFDFTSLAASNKSCAHPIGYPTALWGDWRKRPATGEDYVYLLWQWTDCCVGVVNQLIGAP